MKTRAVRMYGTRDLRLEEFDLPEIRDDEILVKVMSDSLPGWRQEEGWERVSERVKKEGQYSGC